VKLTSKQWRKVELIPGWLDYQNAQLLYSIAINSNLNAWGDILEIGAYYGKSSALLAYSLKENEELICIDSFGKFSLAEESETNSANQNIYYESLSLKRFYRFYGWATKKKVHALVGLSSKVLPTINKHFRLIHIDGGHTYEDVRFDITNSINLLNLNGLMVFDDYGNEMWPGVKKAVDEFLLERKLIPIFNLGKLYCVLPEYSDLFIEKIPRELKGFEVIEKNQNSKLDPLLEVRVVYKQPKPYPYLYRRLLTAILSRI
jgi:predicted O-methyltransferase YrrM